MSQNGNRFFILRHFIGWVKENEEWNFLLFIVEASERSAFHRMSYKKKSVSFIVRCEKRIFMFGWRPLAHHKIICLLRWHSDRLKQRC